MDLNNDIFDNENSDEALNKIVNFILRNILWFLIFAVFFGIGSYLIVKNFVPKEYVSTIKLYTSVDYKETDISSINSELTYTKSIVNTYIGILNSNDYFEKISNMLNNQYSQDDLAKAISFTAVKDTSLITVAVITNSAEDSYAIANCVSNSVADTIYSIDEHSIIKIVESPRKATVYNSISLVLIGIAGALLGLIFCFIILYIKNLLSIKIKSDEDLKNKYREIPILSEIPHFNK